MKKLNLLSLILLGMMSSNLLAKDVLPENRLDIKIKVAGENSRVLIVTPHGKEYEELCEAVL